MDVIVLFGGSSTERAISLNSARSLVDHLSSLGGLRIRLVFLSLNHQFVEIDKTWLYCNTTGDFEFKIQSCQRLMTQTEFVKFAKQSDLVFPMIHGSFGEDGTLQSLLESAAIPFVGCSSQVARRLFKKSEGLSTLQEAGFFVGPFLKVSTNNFPWEQVEGFLEKHPNDGYIIKPNEGGSSIGVMRFESLTELRALINCHSAKLLGADAIIEPYHRAQEFSIGIIQIDGEPHPLVPCSIHYPENQFFDFRKKYLPDTTSTWACPGRFTEQIILEIRELAKKLFKLFGCRDWLRIDGWVFADGRITFSDFNITSGLEQNSLFFIQAAVCGMSHQRFCQHLLEEALPDSLQLNKKKIVRSYRSKIRVLFGGNTAERHVSVLSGTNVWLKLRASKNYEPVPYFLAPNNFIYRLTYKNALFHTSEEVFEACLHSDDLASEMYRIPDLADLPLTSTEVLSIDDFCDEAAKRQEYVFLALHGGDGENGVWQERLENYQILFNGSFSAASQVGMDKWVTSEKIIALLHPFLTALEKLIIPYGLTKDDLEKRVPDLLKFFEAHPESIIKPRSDGCSAGIVVLTSVRDFFLYYEYASHQQIIPAHTFQNQIVPVHLPLPQGDLLLEPYIRTEKIISYGQELKRQGLSDWIELTQGVLECEGLTEALEPSVTLSEGAVLSLEEKFQGGTGTNLTPVPFLKEAQREHIKRMIELAASTLAIKDYARFDLFYNLNSQQVIIIEVNTLPALTPSTVLYHQALAHPLKMTPGEFLELIIRRSSVFKKRYYQENTYKEAV